MRRTTPFSDSFDQTCSQSLDCGIEWMEMLVVPWASDEICHSAARGTVITEEGTACRHGINWDPVWPVAYIRLGEKITQTQGTFMQTQGTPLFPLVLKTFADAHQTVWMHTLETDPAHAKTSTRSMSSLLQGPSEYYEVLPLSLSPCHPRKTCSTNLTLSSTLISFPTLPTMFSLRACLRGILRRATFEVHPSS